MGQQRVILDVTEYEAKVIRWALRRAQLVTPAWLRGRIFLQKLTSATEAVEAATGHLEDLPIPRYPKR